MCKISIIVPVYNGEKYIRKCLDSILKQTISGFEVLLINDGSTDDTLKILNEYAKLYSDRFKVFTIKNSGQGVARNYGVKQAKGDYLAFVDSDDYIEVDMYEKMYELAVKDGLELVVCPYYRVDTKGNILNIELKSIKNVTEINTSPWNKLFNRDIWIKNEIKFAENLWYEDLLATYEYLFTVNKIGFLDTPLYYYVYRQQSSVNIYSSRVNDIFLVLDELYNYLDKKELISKKYSEVEAVFIMHGIMGHLSRCVNEPSIKARHKYIKQSKSYITTKFKFYYRNKYMTLNKSFHLNNPLNYVKYCSVMAIKYNFFDIILMMYRILFKFNISIKRW